MVRFPSKEGVRKGLMRLVLKGSFLACLLFAGLTLFYVFDSIGFRKIVFEPVRELYFFEKELGVAPGWQKIERAIIGPSKTVTIPPDDRSSLKIVADFREPNGEGKRPAILLLHGEGAVGRKSGLIQLVGYRFQQAGWLVLSPDARGFGDSGRPTDVLNPETWRVREDVQRAIHFIWSHPTTDRTRIFVLGHSMGAGHALEGALDDERVKALVLIGPPRYVAGTELGHWYRVRFSAVRNLDGIVSEDVIRSRIDLSNLAGYARGRLKDANHKPIVLVDGDLEGQANLDFLSRVASEIHPPIRYHTLPGTGHYCGVYNLCGSETVYYRPDLFEPFFRLLLGELGDRKDVEMEQCDFPWKKVVG